MSFVDFYFYPVLILLLLLVVLLQMLLRKSEKLSNTVSKSILLFFSYLLMLLYDYRFCICIAVVILVTYFGAAVIGKADDRRRKHLTAAVVIFLLGVLGLFKYSNFFMSTAMALLGKRWRTLDLILPIGISFYIFSAVGYVLDVSWDRMEAENSLLDLALFLSFFPKLICGPIVAGRDFLPQMKENRRITRKNMETGIQIFVFGLFKKLVLADHLGVFVNQVFETPAAFGTATVWWAVFSYFLQLYFDFSGYSDMAIGVSKIFGYEINRNFNLPFVAQNISGFWDRWHISLTTWLNEYLFNPIALNLRRKVASLSKERRKRYKHLPTYIATLITFLVSGLWHGAGFTFLLWGLCHGVYSVLHAVYADRMRKSHKGFAEHKGRPLIVLDILANYFVLNLIQVFFRAESVGQAFYILGRMFTFRVGLEQPYTWTFFAYILLAVATLAAYRKSKTANGEIEAYYPIMDLNTVKGLTIFFVFCGLTIILAYFGETYFIYGNF